MFSADDGNIVLFEIRIGRYVSILFVVCILLIFFIFDSYQSTNLIRHR